MSNPTLEIGDIAPAITLPRDGGDMVALSDYAGQNVVLYFYPRDDTPGCTKEAIGFTDMTAEFAAANTVVLGVSKDSVKKHDKFRDKHNLGVALLSDENGDVCERYGVWVEKNMYGKTYMGIERATFLIDPSGRIAQVWRKVKVPGHVDAVLAAARAL
ncbi:thioredoxin-dependent thiol peroxidase [Octadecabacter sp. R77987]|uniref:thioredoxin-dependent thiol peroxidase n=1 Tax=Octadecabacter sp. R77987 TaxID=3093874 RepID=UPI00366E5EF6